MAKDLEMKAVIKLTVDSEGAEKELNKRLANAQKVVDKNGGIVYKVDVDDDGLVKVADVVKNINKLGNSIVVDVDAEATAKKLGTTVEMITSTIEKLRDNIQKLLNGATFGGSGGLFNENVFSKYVEKFKTDSKEYQKQLQAIAKAEQDLANTRSKNIEGDLYFKNIKKTLQKILSGSATNDDLIDFTTLKSGLEDSLDADALSNLKFDLTDADGNNIVFDFSKIEQEYNKAMQKLITFFNNDNTKLKNAQNESTNRIFDNINKQIDQENKKLESQITKLEQSIQDKQKRLQTIENKLLGKAREEYEKDISRGTVPEEYQKAAEQVITSDVEAKIKITPEDIQGFYTQIEEYGNVNPAKIKVEVANPDNLFDNVKKEIIVDAKLDSNTTDELTSGRLFSHILKKRKEYADYDADTTMKQLSSYVSNIVEKNYKVEEKQYADIYALVSKYKNFTGGDGKKLQSPLSNLLKDAGADFDKFYREYDKVENKFKSEYEKRNPVSVNIRPENIEGFHQKIEEHSKTNPVKVHIDVANPDTAFSKLTRNPLDIKVNATVGEVKAATSDKDLQRHQENALSQYGKAFDSKTKRDVWDKAVTQKVSELKSNFSDKNIINLSALVQTYNKLHEKNAFALDSYLEKAGINADEYYNRAVDISQRIERVSNEIKKKGEEQKKVVEESKKQQDESKSDNNDTKQETQSVEELEQKYKGVIDKLKMIVDLKQQIANLNTNAEDYEAQSKKLLAQEKNLSESLLKELTGKSRVNSRDLHGLAEASSGGYNSAVEFLNKQYRTNIPVEISVSADNSSVVETAKKVENQIEEQVKPEINIDLNDKNIQEKTKKLEELKKIIDAGDTSILSKDKPNTNHVEWDNLDELSTSGATSGLVKQSAVKNQIKVYREMLKAGADVKELEAQAKKIAKYIDSSSFEHVSDAFSNKDVKSGLAAQVEKMIKDAYAANSALQEYNSLKKEIETEKQKILTNTSFVSGNNSEKDIINSSKLSDDKPFDDEPTTVAELSSIVEKIKEDLAKISSNPIDVEINPIVPDDFVLEIKNAKIISVDANGVSINDSSSDNFVAAYNAKQKELKDVEAQIAEIEKKRSEIEARIEQMQQQRDAASTDTYRRQMQEADGKRVYSAYKKMHKNTLEQNDVEAKKYALQFLAELKNYWQKEEEGKYYYGSLDTLYKTKNSSRPTDKDFRENYYGLMHSFDIVEDEIDKMVAEIQKSRYEQELVSTDDDHKQIMSAFNQRSEIHEKQMAASDEMKPYTEQLVELRKQRMALKDELAAGNFGNIDNLDFSNNKQTIPLELSPSIEWIKTNIAKIGDDPISLKLDETSINNLIQKVNDLNGKKIDIDLSFKGIDLDTLKTSIKGINDALESVTTNVEQSSTKQITSIGKITTSIDGLVNNLKSIGALSIKDLDKVMKAAAKAAKDNLDIKKHEQQLSQEIVKTEQQKVKLEQEREALAKKKLETQIAKINLSNKELEAEKKLLELANKKASAEAKNKKAEDEAKEQKKQQEQDNKALTQKEIIDAQNSLIAAANNTKNFQIDESSIKMDSKGIITFSAIIEEMGEKAVKATYKIEDLNKAITNGGKLSNKQLGKSFTGSKIVDAKVKKEDPSIKINAQKEKALSALRGVEGFDESSFKIDATGAITFNRVIEQAGEGARTLKYEVEEINKLLFNNGNLRKSFFNQNSGKDITYRDEIESTTQRLEDVIKSRRIAEEAYHSDADLAHYMSKGIEYIREEKLLREDLNFLMERANLNEEEREAILKRITAATEAQLDVVKITSEYQRDVDKVKNSYDKVIGSLDIGNLLNTQVVDDKGNILGLVDEVTRLKTEADEAFGALNKNAFSSNSVLESTISKLQEILEKIETLNVVANQKNYKQGKKNVNYMGTAGLGDIEMSDAAALEKMAVDKLKSAGYESVEIIGKFDKALNSVKVKLRNKDRVEDTVVFFQKIIDETGNAVVAIRKLDGVESDYVSNGSKWVSGLKSKITNLTQYISGIELVMGAWNKAREGFNFVKELNTSMTTIYQTMDITTEGLEQLSVKSIQAAKNLGAVSDQMIDSVNIYAAYGKTVDEIINQATPTVMLANAMQGDSETASDYIQGVIQQYTELEGQETQIVNTFEKIASLVQIDFPKAIQGMAEGVQNAGSVMREAGVDFELFGASIAKVQEVTRLEGSQISNAMKTIASRISRSKSGDEDVTAEDRSNASKAYASVGINVYEDDGSYKGLNNILDELAVKWDTLTDAQRNYIAEQSAGVRNVNIFNTMLNTWEEANQLASDVNEDQDYYLEVQEKHMESMQAKLNTLTATMQEFWYNLIDTGAVNLIIDALTGIVQVCEMVVEAFKTVGSVFGETGGSIGGIAGVAAVVATVANAWDSFNTKVTTDLGDGKTITKRAGFIGMFKDLSTGLGDLQDKAQDTWDTFKLGFAGRNKEGIYIGGQGLLGGIKAVTASLTPFQTALFGVGAALAAIGVGIAIFDGLTDSTKETAETVEKLSETYEQTQSKLKNYKETTDSIGKEFATLSEGVNTNTNENISLTTEEYSRYLEIVNQIAEMYPSVVKSYDAQGNAILTLEGDIRKLNEAYDEYRLNAAKENLGNKTADGSYENLDTYKENLRNVTGNRSWGTKAWDVVSSDMFSYAEIGGRVTAGEVVDALEDIQNMTYDEVKAWMEENKNSDIYSWLSDPENLGLTADKVQNTRDGGSYVIAGTTEEEWIEMQKTITSLINETNTEVLEAANNLRNGLQSYLVELEFGKFNNVDESVFNQVSNFISSMSVDLLRELSGTEGALESYIENLVSKLSNSAQAQLSLNEILNIDGNSSLEDVKFILGVDPEDGVETAIEVLAKELDANADELKVQLGFEDSDELIAKYDQVVNETANKIQAEGKTLLDKVNDVSKGHGGNVNLYNRPVISSEDMNAAGWDTEEGYLSTYLSDVRNKLDNNGNIEESIVFTPIYRDESGKEHVLTPEQFEDETQKILEGAEDVLGITLAKFDSKDYKDAAKQADKFAKELHEASDYYDLLEEDAGRVKDFIRDQNITTLDELALLQQCVNTTDSWAEAMQKFEMVHISTDFEEVIANLESNLTVVSEDITGINEAISASNSAAGLSAEQIENITNAFSDLKDEAGNAIFDYDKLFESTASGVRLNAYELERLNDEYDKAQKAKYTDTLDDMQKEYEDLCLAIVDTKDEQEQLNLIAKRNNLKEQIEQVQELTSRYGGLTSAYNDWQNAQSTADSYEMYDNIYSGIEEIDELYQRDLTGSDDFKSYMQQFYYGDLDEYLTKAGKSYQQFYEENAEMIQTYFTEDNTGSINFLNKLQEFGYAWQNELGQWEINGDVEEIAKSFGWATSTIDAQFKKLEAHEFKFQFVETEPLDELKAKAEEVTDFIAGKFGEEYRFDFNTDSVDVIDGYISQLETLKNQSGLTTEEIEALNAQIEYWTAKKGELTKGVEFEFSLDATIAELELCQDKLKELGKISVDFNLNPSTLKEAQAEILKVQDLLEEFRGTDGQIDITQEGAEETLAILANLMKTKIELTNPVVMNVDTSKVTGDVSTVIQNIQAYQDAVNNLDTIKQLNADYNLNLDTTDAQKQVDTALANLQNTDKGILAKLGIDPSSETTIGEKIKAITPEMMVKAGVNEEAILGYTPDNKDATVIYDVDRTKVNEFLDANLDRNATVTYTYVASNNIPTSAAVAGAEEEEESGDVGVNGTAHVNGTARSTLLQRGMAFAKGTWGAVKNGMSLVGELGR